MASAAVEEIKSDEKMMIIDSVSSLSLAIENCASRSKTESDEKKKMMITDSSRSSLAPAEKTMTKRPETESGCRRSWSNLPIDMVKVILRELPSLYDRIRGRAVCKNWLLPLNEIRTSSERLPWLLLFKWDDHTNDIQANLSLCKLVDPLYKEQKSSYFQQLENIRNKKKKKRPKSFDPMMYRGTKVCASKNDWVMFYHLSRQRRVRRTSQEPKFDRKTSFFLYNPFTKHTITLPDLITPYINEFHPSFDIATFSSSPDEDDCVFLVVRRDLSDRYHSFYATYSRSIMEQQQKWKIDLFKEENMIGCDRINGSVYIDGIFYCVSYHGTLMSFNVTLHEWTILTALWPIQNVNFYPNYLVELNGELLVVYGWLRVERLYVFDKSSRVWVRGEDIYLKDRALALFLGSYGSFAFSVDGVDVDQNEIANYASKEVHETLYYSFVNKSDNWEGNLHELYGAQLRNGESTKIWIQPPSKFWKQQQQLVQI